MRVLMLASYFPKPENRVMGNWALSQAQAFLRNDMDVSVISGTSWIPKFLGVTNGARAYANCPSSYVWDTLPVAYPRWLFYSAKPLRSLLASHPNLLLGIAWLSVRHMLLAAIKEFRPDVIYAHHTQVNGYMAWQLHKVTGIPYVITDHDFGEIDSCYQNPARYSFFASIIAKASCMIAVSHRMERSVTKLFPTARTSTVHNGSEPPDNSLQSVPRPAEISGRLVVFAACAFYERKGVPLLIRAFARIAAQFPLAVLRIAGDGDMRPQVEAAIEQTGILKQVQLLGQISHEKVLQEMAWADIFALPGWDEPFATVFTESLSVGCPIIYASDGGITDVVVDGTHGLAVEPRSEESLASALVVMLADEPRRQAMGLAAKELFATKLLWDRNAAGMKAIFDSAVAGSVN